MVLELPALQQFYARPGRGKERFTEAGIGIAQVLGRQRQVNGAPAAVAHGAGQHVEQDKERRLAAVGNRDVGGAQLPAELRPQERGKLLPELQVALGRLVDPEQAVTSGGVLHQRLQALLEDPLYRGQAARIAAAHEDHLGVFIEGAAQVTHQLDNT